MEAELALLFQDVYQRCMHLGMEWVINVPIAGFQSRCAQRQRIVVSKDRFSARKHIAHNKHCVHVTHYRIDGEVITEGMRCDFLLMNENTHTAYLIELKGSDITQATRQLESTQFLLKEHLTGYYLQFRIIASKSRTHQIQSTAYRKFAEARRGAVVCKTDQ